MKIRKYLRRIIFILIIVFNLLTFSFPYRTGFDKSTAEDLLKDAYMPLEAFVKAGTPTEDEKFLLSSNDIKNMNDFIISFDNKIDQKVLEGFYKDLVVERQGELFIDKTAYIPNIYAEDSKLSNAYIKRSKSLNSFITGEDETEEELVIKEKWKISGEWHRRSNYFVKDENGNWVLDYFNGTSMYKFVDYNHNPWSDKEEREKL